MKRLSVAVFALLLAPRPAQADVPPPDGRRQVQYAFRVDGLDKFPDRAVVAFPWSLSNGAPTQEITLVENAKNVYLGRRSPTPQLYTVKRAAWDAFSKEMKPHSDPAFREGVEKFLATAVKCTVTLTPVHEAPSNAPSEVVEAFSAKALSDAACEIVSASTLPKSAGPVAPTSGALEGERPTGSATPAAASGCAACSIGGTAGWEPALLAVGAAILGASLRRRRPSRE